MARTLRIYLEHRNAKQRNEVTRTLRRDGIVVLKTEERKTTFFEILAFGTQE